MSIETLPILDLSQADDPATAQGFRERLRELGLGQAEIDAMINEGVLYQEPAVEQLKG